MKFDYTEIFTIFNASKPIFLHMSYITELVPKQFGLKTIYPSNSIILMSYYTSEPVLMRFQPFYTLKDVFEKLVSNVCVFLGTLRPKC